MFGGQGNSFKYVVGKEKLPLLLFSELVTYFSIFKMIDRPDKPGYVIVSFSLNGLSFDIWKNNVLYYDARRTVPWRPAISTATWCFDVTLALWF